MWLENFMCTDIRCLFKEIESNPLTKRKNTSAFLCTLIKRNKRIDTSSFIINDISLCCICSSRNITTTWYGKSVKITKITLHKTFNLQPNLTIFLLNSFYNDLSPYKKNHRLISHISHLAATYCRMWKWKIFAMCSMCSPRCSPGLVMCTQTEALNFWIYLTVTNRVVARKFECQRGEEKKHILYKTRGLHAKGIWWECFGTIFILRRWWERDYFNS